MIEVDFLDTINYSICRVVDGYLKDKAEEFFRKVGESNLEEILRKGHIRIKSDDEPLEVLIKIARYLESVGYMEKIIINKLSDKEAIVEMYGVSVTKSSTRLLKEGKQPSHYMTNIMFAALRRLGVQANLKDMEYNEKDAHFKEYWKIL